MKQFGKKLLVLCLVVVSIFALTACGNSDKLSGNATVVVGNTPYVVNFDDTNFTTNSTVLDLLDFCEQKGKFSFVADQGQTYLTQIGNLQQGANSYVAFYHNQEAHKDVSAYAQPNKTYDGKTMYYSGVGVGSLKLCDGLVVYFTNLTY